MLECKLHCISLVCREDALKRRLTLDVERGIRQAEVIERSIARILVYDNLDTVKVDVSNITPETAAERIMEL